MDGPLAKTTNVNNSDKARELLLPRNWKKKKTLTCLMFSAFSLVVAVVFAFAEGAQSERQKLLVLEERQ
jgi:predicted nucleic acid-binding Zn ribbon protein